MTALEVIIVLITLLSFGLLVISTVIRLRSRDVVIFHLMLYGVTGLLFTILLLFQLPVKTTLFPGLGDASLARFISLAMALTFGGLTLSFLKKRTKTLLAYWTMTLLLLGIWSVLNFDPQNWGQQVATLVRSERQMLTSAVAITGWAVAMIIAVLAVVADFRKHRSAQHLNRLRYWLIATTLLGVSGLIFFVNPAVFAWAGLALLLSGSAIAAYVILRHQTPDLNRLVGLVLRHISVMMTLSTIFLLGVAIAISIYRVVSTPAILILWSIIIAIALANIFPPLWRFSHKLFTRIIFGKQTPDQPQVIKHYSQSLSKALDMQRLGDTVINLMIETLGLEKGIVFVNERHGSGDVELRPLSSIGVDNPGHGIFATDSPFINYFRQGHKYVTQYDLDVLPDFRDLPPQEKQWLDSLGMEIFTPIMRQLEFVGLLAFGPQPQGTAYYDEDIDLMITLAGQTALAMDSARLFEQLATINQEVGHLSAQLANLDETKGDFLSIASHELRTPLTQIHGYSQMLLDITESDLQDPTYLKTLIEGVVKGSERMKSVIDLMFDVTEVDAGVVKLFKGPVHLMDVIREAVNPYLAALDDRWIALAINGLEDLPAIEADGTRLVQAFENLVSNAVKYTPDGGKIEISGRTYTHDEMGPVVEIVVSDTGIGIDPEYHQKIFEKFFRIDDTLHHSTGKTKFKGAGPGLGLTLVQGIAEAHNGRVWVESPGHDETNYPGSRFFFVIPMQTSSETEATQHRRQAEIETRHWRRSDFGKK